MNTSIFKFGIFWAVFRQSVFIFVVIASLAISNSLQIVMLIGLSGAGFASVVLFLLGTLLKTELLTLVRVCLYNQVFQVIFALFFYFASTLLNANMDPTFNQVSKGIVLIILFVETYIGYILFKALREGD